MTTLVICSLTLYACAVCAWCGYQLGLNKRAAMSREQSQGRDREGGAS